MYFSNIMSVRTAINRALHNEKNKEMVSFHRNTEVLLSLSPHNNISKSFSEFGLTARTYNLVSVCLDPDEKVLEDKVRGVKEAVEGEVVNDCRGYQFDELEIQSVYSVTDEELDVSSLEHCVLMKIATK